MLVKSLDRRSFLKLSAIAGVAAGTPLSEFLEWRMASAQAKTLTAAYSNAGLVSTWDAQGKDTVDYFASLLNVKVDWKDPAQDEQQQRQAFDEFALGQYDFLGVQPVSIGILVEPITKIIKDNNTPVISIDTLIAPLDEMKDMGVLTLMSCDNITLAEGVVNTLVTKMGGKGKIVRIGGKLGHTGAQARGQGFHNVIDKYVTSNDIEIVDEEPGDWSTEKTAGIWKNLLNRYPDINGAFHDNDDMALAAQAVIADAGKDKQIFIGGIDAMQPAIEAVIDGRLAATARNSATRVHGWSVVVGAYAATIGLEKARSEIPFFLLIDGPAIVAGVDSNDKWKDTPWMLKNYGMSSAPGQKWLEDHFLF
jgi:ribose transport system substrate-binding protein